MLESHTTTTTSTTEHYVLQVRRGHLLSLFLIFFFIWMDLVICWPCPERVYVLFEPGVSMIFCIRNEKALIAAMVNRRSLSMRRVANNSETDPAAFQCFLKDFVCCTCPSSFVLILILPAINQCQHDFLHLSFFFSFFFFWKSEFSYIVHLTVFRRRGKCWSATGRDVLHQLANISGVLYIAALHAFAAWFRDDRVDCWLLVIIEDVLYD